MAERSRVVAVLGDLVASREAPDRAALQRALEDALGTVDAQLPAPQPLTPTVGDEFQGLFADLDAALAATLWARLLLLPRSDVRFGLGVGELVSHDVGRAPYAQDGPAWWAAREALEHVERAGQAHASPPGWRTCVRLAGDPAPPGEALPDGPSSPSDGPASSDEALPTGRHARPALLDGADPEGLVNAFLVCRDELVAGLDDRDARILVGCLEGRSQAAIAEAEGVSASAVSQRLRRNGGYALLRSRHLAGRS